MVSCFQTFAFKCNLRRYMTGEEHVLEMPPDITLVPKVSSETEVHMRGRFTRVLDKIINSLLGTLPNTAVIGAVDADGKQRMYYHMW